MNDLFQILEDKNKEYEEIKGDMREIIENAPDFDIDSVPTEEEERVRREIERQIEMAKNTEEGITLIQKELAKKVDFILNSYNYFLTAIGHSSTTQQSLSETEKEGVK